MITIQFRTEICSACFSDASDQKARGRVKEPVGCTCNHGMTSQKATLPKINLYEKMS